MRVLLTGASGFIGSHVARLALTEGHEIMALVRPGSSLRRLEGVQDRLQLLEGDLRDARALETPLRASVPEVCLHLAWYAEPGQYLGAPENLDCLKGGLTFMRVLHDIGCSRLVTAGTSLEYETSTSVVTETSPIRPTTLYAAAKHSLFLTASNFDVHGEWSVASARIFCVYGPRERSAPAGAVRDLETARRRDMRAHPRRTDPRLLARRRMPPALCGQLRNPPWWARSTSHRRGP